jgi:hypothetical protein
MGGVTTVDATTEERTAAAVEAATFAAFDPRGEQGIRLGEIVKATAALIAFLDRMGDEFPQANTMRVRVEGLYLNLGSKERS